MNGAGYEAISVKSRVRGDDGARLPAVVVGCSKCDEEAIRWINSKFNPHLSKEAFERDGWMIGRKTALCPECNSKTKHKEPKLTVVINSPPAVIDPQKALTPEQRTKVRSALDEFFDDQKGYYLDGQSDHSIASKIGVPWALIRDLREVAYGPLKGSVETVALKADIDRAFELIRVTRAECEKSLKLCDDAIQRLRERAHTMEKRMGIP